ncbi:hypothetical protein A2303_06055 [Candidatus Falkowbacteria bacterium RIFOXYB2_FULL_47_14]|uniref:Uncharacterized protein n=1 Tax=Candidatus Falkowbacteria bacterium RIFOXYA2_FULL_47_19 TaxID=1797994 RepID=A0A1F5SI39_9BACT|nr:MAG: hypothetical protein A2227_03745 [Candidatus Falkowbacteria bacterium RIFOXYA2_FULL_47_19]OGF35417.1 MAG: hypothetical protein A2468_03020 [Candidatus Falkowbacteria bacterium RIFOXYC2_FULL_46_15]OGF43800.1 MAG: hypothetical protein A2303_06055 [Candidatus Falkowbacteria bacterium RIFOXYB2_FULL_47_14]
MFNIIPLILILLGLAAIIVIVVRKFSILANLDIDNIPAEREAKFKEQIIGKRMKRNFLKYYSRLARIIGPLGEAIGNLFKWLHERLLEFKENYNREKAAPVDTEAGIDRLFLEIEEAVKKSDWEGAEKRYIEIIAIDSQNVKAFRGLGLLYYNQKNYGEASQTLEHALKLLEKKYEAEGNNDDTNTQLAAIYFDLGEVDRITENYANAAANLDKALAIEPNNPRFLDGKLEISIAGKDKIGALEAYERMAAVNPENQKLAIFKEEIDKL